MNGIATENNQSKTNTNNLKQNLNETFNQL